MNRDAFIFKRVNEHHHFLEEKGYIVVATFLQGSQNYGLDIDDVDYVSDIDTKSIVLPTLESIIAGDSPISAVEVLDNNEHAEVKDIRVMFEMFEKANIAYLELLVTRYRIVNVSYRDLVAVLLTMKEDIIAIDRNRLLRCIAGMSREKLKSLEHPYPGAMDKIEKFGYDPKQLHHILRLYDFLTQLISGVPFDACFIPTNRDYLLSVKTGKYELNDARNLAVMYNEKINEIVDNQQSEMCGRNGITIAKLDELKRTFIERCLRQELAKEMASIKKKPSGRIWVTSDLHIGHWGRDGQSTSGILALDNRPFESLEDMKRCLIENWNRCVNENDEVYILGDLSFESAEKVNELLKTLKGIKHLIVGNHDEYLKNKKFDKDLFASIQHAHEITYKGKKIIMSHYPMAVNDLPSRRIIALHGHVHMREPLFNTFNMYNVGCMLHGYKPVPLDYFVNKSIEEQTL